MPNTPRRPAEHTAAWTVAALVAAAVCCAGTTLLVAFGAGAVLATVGATLGKPQVLLPRTPDRVRLGRRRHLREPVTIGATASTLAMAMTLPRLTNNPAREAGPASE